MGAVKASGARWAKAAHLLALGVLAVLAAGCENDQSTLSPASDAARDVATLWWVLFAVSVVAFAVVLALVVFAVLRARGAESDAPPERGESRAARRLMIVGGAAVPTVVLVVLYFLTIHTLPAISADAPAEGGHEGDEALRIDVTGRQWFWDVRYADENVRTANEIHIPVGERVALRLASEDVIHSFWVPELAPKVDMIPGQTNSLVLEASRAGTYRGQCAEYCGLQHANMALWVVADPPARFQEWLAQQRAVPPDPADPLRTTGQQVFLGSACVYCHRIAGTNATGTIGPDLTHVASRRTLAAGTIPNTRGYLAGWILDPQHVKPGNKMPATDLSGPELQALLSYLEGLR